MRVERNVESVGRHAQDARRFLEADFIHVQPHLSGAHAVVDHGHHPVGLEHLLDRLALIGVQVKALHPRGSQKRLDVANLAGARRVEWLWLAAHSFISQLVQMLAGLEVRGIERESAG